MECIPFSFASKPQLTRTPPEHRPKPFTHRCVGCGPTDVMGSRGAPYSIEAGLKGKLEAGHAATLAPGWVDGSEAGDGLSCPQHQRKEDTLTRLSVVRVEKPCRGSALENIDVFVWELTPK